MIKEISVCVFAVSIASVTVAWATPLNLALDKPVTPDGGSVYGDPSLAVDGEFCNGCVWNSAGPYWYGTVSFLDIDLEGAYVISGAIVQADSNDTYLLQYRDPLGTYHDWWNIPASPLPGGGLSTRPNNDDNTEWHQLPSVTATGLRLWATAGDGSFAVSEVQIADVPEPAAFALLSAGLLGLYALARKHRRAA